MYKAMSIIMSLFLIVSLAACGTTGGTSPDNTNGGSGGSNGTDTPDSTISLTGEITVTAYDSMRSKAFLEEAALLFEEKYPGTKVNVETFSAMPEIRTSEQGGMRMSMVEMQDDPQGRHDYINKVNTSLMSGRGADILAMDVLPIHKYADSGQLENLAAYMQADPQFNPGDYRANIIDAARYKGGTWFMPLDYTFDYYAYDSTLINGNAASGFGADSALTAGELVALGMPLFDGSDKMFNRADYTGGRGGSMWDILLSESYTSFVDVENKRANFNDGSFAALLESVKEYSELGYITEGVTGQQDAGAIMQRAASGEGPTDRAFFKPKNVFSLTRQYTRDLNLMVNMAIGGGVMTIEDDDEIAGIVSNADGSVPFTFDQAYGINSGSQNKETAWAFIKFLLSEEMQLANTMPTSLPLLNSAREKKAENTLTGLGAMRGYSAQGGQGGQAPQMTEAQQAALAEALTGYNAAVERLSNQINAYIFKDTIVNDMISSEVQYFFEGSKSAEEVANVLQNRVNLYLNE